MFHRLLMDLGGWAQHARWLLWQAEQDGTTDGTLGDLLAVRLIWEEALFNRFQNSIIHKFSDGRVPGLGRDLTSRGTALRHLFS